MVKVIGAWVLLLSAAVPLSAQTEVPELIIALPQGIHYSSLPDLEVRALHYDTGVNLGLHFPIGSSPFRLGVEAGFQLVPPPRAGEVFAIRGFWGYRNSILLQYRMEGISLGAAAGLQAFRYWNTRILFVTPELSLFTAVPILRLGDGEAGALLQLRPRIYVQLRPDTGFSGGLGIAVVFNVPMK
jgi:hypothetical protein